MLVCTTPLTFDLAHMWQVHPHNMGVLGPDEKEYLEPPPDEAMLYEQFNSIGLKVLARESIKYVGLCLCVCSA